MRKVRAGVKKQRTKAIQKRRSLYPNARASTKLRRVAHATH